MHKTRCDVAEDLARKLEWQIRVTQRLWHKVSILNKTDTIQLLKEIEKLL